MPAALITGIGGQDGSILAGQLAEQGMTVHGLVRASELADAQIRLSSAVTLHVGDLTDGDRVSGLVDDVAPAEIYNLAGITSVRYSWDHPVETGEVTGLAAASVFAAALRLQETTGRAVRVLQPSSAEIFGHAARVPQDETTPIAPASPYGAAKAYAHFMAASYRILGLHVATCILYNHESPLRSDAFVTRKITAAAARIAHDGAGTLTLGDLSVRRDWGWAEDYVDAMVRATRHTAADDFVVATGETHSVAEFAAAALRRVGIDDWERYVRTDAALVRPSDAPQQVGDASKARRELGWAPTVGFDELVGRMVDHDVALLAGSA